MSERNGLPLMPIAALAVLIAVVGGLFVAGVFDEATPVEGPSIPTVRSGDLVGSEETDLSEIGSRPRIVTEGFNRDSRDASVAALDGRDTGLMIDGRVSDENGAAVPEAAVVLSRDVGTIVGRFVEGEELARVSTRKDGSFRFVDLPTRTKLVIRVEHEGYAVERLAVETSQDKTLRPLIRLVAGISFFGSVVDQAQAPIGGARVAIYDMALQGSDPRGVLERYAESNDDGTFEVAHVKPGNKKVIVTKEGYAADGIAAINLSPINTPESRFVLGQGLVIAGTVIDAITGDPIVGARIMARPVAYLPGAGNPGSNPDPRGQDEDEPDSGDGYKKPQQPGGGEVGLGGARPQGGDPRRAAALRGVRGRLASSVGEKSFLVQVAESDEEGRFLIGGLISARYQITATCGGFLPLTGRAASAGMEGLQLRMSPTARISGVVVDAETNEPIPHFNVTVHPTMDPIFFNPATKQHFSNPDGAFEYTDVKTGGLQYVFVEAEGYAIGRSEGYEVVPMQRVDGVVVRLERGATLTGRVVDAKGEPIRGARARLVRGMQGAAQLNPITAIIQNQMRGNATLSARTDADGVYVIKNVGAGTFSIDISHPNHIDASTDSFSCDGRGEFDITTVMLGEGGTIRGIVRNDEGGGDAGAMVMLRSTSGIQIKNPTIEADELGRFERRGIPPGSYKVVVSRRAGTFNLAELLNPESGQQVEIAEGTVIDLEL